MKKETAYHKALCEIAAMPIAGKRTNQSDIDNYERAVLLARTVLVKYNRSMVQENG